MARLTGAAPGPAGAVFFSSDQRTGERTRMHRHAEARPDGYRPVGRGAGPILDAVLLDEVEDLVRALVRALRPAGAGQQPREPGRGEGRRRRVEGLAAHPKRPGHFADRPLVDAM